MGAIVEAISELSPCRAACPAGIDIPRYIRYIRKGDFDQALAVIREKIPFAAVCGYACVHPCEAKCARVQYDEPVSIRMLKRAAWENSRGTGEHPGNLAATGKRVAVVGAGPCGLTAAYYLAGQGHDVTVYEAMALPGGMLRYGIPQYRLPNSELDREIEFIAKRGVKINTNTRVPSAKVLLEEGFDAVLAASGAWKPLQAGIAGNDSTRVLDGIAFLQDINEGKKVGVGSRVAVVGGGNTALDAARASVRLGAQVSLLYRRNREQMPASAEEVAQALEEGVKIYFLTAPVKVEPRGVLCQKMQLGEPGQDGRPRPVPLQGSEFTLECDTLIMAVGQAASGKDLQLEETGRGSVKVDYVTLATPCEGVFAAGDAVTGPSSIIQAIAQGRQAAVSMDSFLGGDGAIDRPLGEECCGEVQEPAPMGTWRLPAKNISLEERLGGFGTVELGYGREAAMAEASRCLACDIRDFRVEVNPLVCKDCGYCREVCSLDIFKKSETFNPSGYKPAVAENTHRCVACLKCLYVCPDFAVSINSVCDCAGA